MKRLAAYFIALSLLAISAAASAFPNKIFSVTLDIGKAEGGMAITDDNRYIFSADGNQLSRIDTATFALTSDQPPELSTDKGNNGNIQWIEYVSSSGSIYAILDTGKLLNYSLSSITNDPSIQIVYADRNLGPMAVDTNSSTLVFYPVYQTDDIMYQFVNGSGSVSSTTYDLKGAVVPSRTFDVSDMIFNTNTNDIYISTDIGYVIWSNPTSSPSPAAISVDGSTQTAEIASLAAAPDVNSYLYCPRNNSSGGNIIYIDVIDMSTRSLKDPIPVSTDYNSAFVSMVMQEDTTSTTTYGFVSGQKGVSVMNVSNNTMINADGSSCSGGECNPVTATVSGPMVASTDGYIYMSTDSGMSVLTDRPWVEITDVLYEDSTGAETTVLEEHGTVTFTFNSDTAGTYKVYSGGSIDMSGHIMTDINGQTSGAIAADTDTEATFAYDTNVSILEGGTNTIFIFVTDSSNLTGRMATTIEADIPPRPVTINSTGFGNTRVYLNFQRLTATNISSYNLYADTDPANVIVKTTTSATAVQPTSGTNVSAPIGGLTNGLTYYLAIEGVNTSGTVGTRTYLLPDGTQASAIPQETVGPAAYSGETGGCSLIRGGR